MLHLEYQERLNNMYVTIHNMHLICFFSIIKANPLRENKTLFIIIIIIITKIVKT